MASVRPTAAIISLFHGELTFRLVVSLAITNRSVQRGAV
jgi:hypothetical protein